MADHIKTMRTVHRIIIPHHFPRMNDPNVNYKRDLEKWMKGNFSTCSINLFVLDEVDKASHEIIDALEELFGRFRNATLTSSRVIVLLLSNTGSRYINNYVHDVIQDGGTWESITHDSIISDIETSSDNELKWYLSLHKKGLIHDIVPFLPLGKKHVAKCIEKDIEEKHETCANPDVVAQVMDELTFFPTENPYFSRSGCREVGFKVDLVINAIESGHTKMAMYRREKHSHE